MNQDEPVQTLQLVSGRADTILDSGVAVLSMSSSSFLAADGNDIKSFILSNDDVWVYNTIFSGHDRKVHSLAKVNDKLFVSVSYGGTAKLWSTSENEKDKDPCLFTFRGHTGLTNSLRSCIYLKKEQVVATGDDDGLINVWSIANFLEERIDEDGDVHHEEP